MASDYNARRIDAEMALQSVLSGIDLLEQIARESPAAVRSTGYFLPEAADRLAALVTKLDATETA